MRWLLFQCRVLLWLAKFFPSILWDKKLREKQAQTLIYAKTGVQEFNFRGPNK